MTNHQKRLSAPESWPVARKTETYTVKADAGPHGEDGVPLVVLLRDVLGYVDSAREARYALDQNNVLVNGNVVTDYRRPIGMFDILAFRERQEYYRVFPEAGGRLGLTPIDEAAAGSKLGKVIGKRQVEGGRTQINLHDGQNLLFDDTPSYGVNDSLVIDTDDDSVVAQFPYETGALVTAVRGSHAGEIGEIERIDVTPGSGPNSVVFGSEDARFETLEKYVVVIDENFTEGGPDTAQEVSSGDAGDEDDVGDEGNAGDQGDDGVEVQEDEGDQGDDGVEVQEDEGDQGDDGVEVQEDEGEDEGQAATDDEAPDTVPDDGPEPDDADIDTDGSTEAGDEE